MKKKNLFEQQMDNVKEETNSSAVLNDVVDTEFEQHPGQNESLLDDSPLTPVQEAVNDNIDGKTWTTIDDE
ncbi:hypothetical protein CR203_20905 [Salipaludibacillus neizhouensis]|uniref:DUF4025 domain-containing protein n=1 Tax=Salipaludibacillus neizhouensis TaxID=885475 RepID=A0A3A9JYZ1_9BACI|nr:hypothetical protein [Salipaludibacillus neizhouensis]RKL65409.1 hypothetical protein CR203_20905 [Salipaludibacillus neizhouensis]